MDARILRLNLAGQPLEWLHWREVVSLYARDLVVWSLGGEVRRVCGGRSRFTGLNTRLSLPAIVACGGEKLAPIRSRPPLTNRGLLLRDGCRCLYCGRIGLPPLLTRDHVHPVSRGGEDKWENVVACCARCNQRKAAWLLSEIDMPLLALPYCPNPYEYMALINSHRIREDQVAYLAPQFQQFVFAGVPEAASVA